MTTATAKRANNRNEVLLDAASSLFAAGGYAATSMRDIAKATGMLPGSIYYHFPSKADLLMAIYERGVDRICDRHDRLIAASTDPWERLEIALANHILTVTEGSDDVGVLNRVLPGQVPEREAELVALRDRFEERVRVLVDGLPLPDGVDRRILRLMVIGATSWTQNWYRPGKTRPEQIAAQYCAYLRQPLDNRK
jgi:AcrR family transcriptional regulator